MMRMTGIWPWYYRNADLFQQTYGQSSKALSVADSRAGGGGETKGGTRKHDDVQQKSLMTIIMDAVDHEVKRGSTKTVWFLAFGR